MSRGSAICTKTGAWVYDVAHRCLIKGDAFHVGGALVLKYNPEFRFSWDGNVKVHYVVRLVNYLSGNREEFGTLVSDDFTYLGNDGHAWGALEADYVDGVSRT